MTDQQGNIFIEDLLNITSNEVTNMRYSKCDLMLYDQIHHKYIRSIYANINNMVCRGKNKQKQGEVIGKKL